MKNAPVEDNLKGFIGFRIVILIVFIFAALLAGLVYFKLIKVSGLPFIKISDVSAPNSDQDKLVADLNKVSQSSSSSEFKQISDINELKNRLKENLVIEATVTSFANDRLDLKTSSDSFLLNPYDFNGYVQVVNYPDASVGDRLLVLKVSNPNDPVKILYEPIFGNDINMLVGKNVKLSLYDTYSTDGKTKIQLVGVMYENK